MAAFRREEFEDYWQIHHSPEAMASRADRSGFASEATLGNRERPLLSDSVWRNREATQEHIFARIRFGIARGEDALSIAQDLEKYLDPSYLPTRTRAGKIIDDGRRRVLTFTPYRTGTTPAGAHIPQRGSYAARRLARTETTAAHGAATLKATEKAGGRIRWLLSNRHPKRDICDKHAGGGEAGDGVYPPRSVPPYPAHPHCLCTLAPVIEFEGIGARLRKEYGLDEPLFEQSDFDFS